MIELTRFNGSHFFLNSDLIKLIEATPDTVITLTTGEKMMVKEEAKAVVDLTLSYRIAIYRSPPLQKT